MSEPLPRAVRSKTPQPPVAVLLLVLFGWLGGCGPTPWNDPYPRSEDPANTYYSSFQERPKHLDPARSYSSNESVFTGAVYEPPLQYHYLKRPYTLEPLLLEQMPTLQLHDAAGQLLPADADPQDIARSVYTLTLKPGVRYQPHPALARDASGQRVYQTLNPGQLDRVRRLADFPARGSREVVAADFAYQIKRLAHPGLHSPILGLMSEYIVGLKDYADGLQARWKQATKDGSEGIYLDLDAIELPGVEVLDRYTWRITLKGAYPQFRYWLAMPFFAPVPVEVERFYAQPGMAERNLSLDWYPVGTGPYQVIENNPNRRIVLARNPNYHGASYPQQGEPGDAAAGLLDDAGQPLPFIDRLVYTLEPETIPRWSKFLQGWYDSSGVASDSFDQAVSFSPAGEAGLTAEMRERGIRLSTSIDASTFYTGFNMTDPVVGGTSPRATKLRQALSLAVDYEEFISIFLNGRGIPAHGPIPPGIFGYQQGDEGANPLVYQQQQGRLQRRPLAEAKRLLAEAGYPDGNDPVTGKPLLLYLDISASGPDDKARLDWWRKQFRKLGIQLVIRNTDYNRFLDKMRKGDAQVFFWGWGADYPDPENFLFLLYGPNGKAEHGGENAANYANADYDRWFKRMKHLANGPQRQRVIGAMLQQARLDAPWLWGFHRVQFSLEHAWLSNVKPSVMAKNTIKYLRLDASSRAEARQAWNQPITWPLWLIAGLFMVLLLPVLLLRLWRVYWPRQPA